MNGKAVGLGILFCAAVAGGALYYLQVFGFYRDVSAQTAEIRLTPAGATEPVSINAENIKAINADSSPIRFRACFDTGETLASLAAEFTPLSGFDPRNAPGWFDCFDAPAIAAALKSGRAQAFLGEKNVAFGVDRIIAITEDGRGYAWHELNDCGEKAYDGTIIGEECPARPGSGQ